MAVEDNQSRELAVAIEAARVASDISRQYYRDNLDVMLKEDKTPVTRADVECEEAIRSIILGAFPDDGFYGEPPGLDTRSVLAANPALHVKLLERMKGFVT